MVENQTPEPDDSRELVPFDQDTSHKAAIHNFEGDAQKLWRMTAAATGPSCKEGSEIIDQAFPLKFWMCHEVTVNNPERGPVKTVRTVLIDPNGNAYGFVSAGVYDSLRLLVQSLGNGPYDPALMIQVTSRSKKGGRKFYAIEPAPDRTDTETR